MPNQQQHWNEIIERYQASGLSQPEFCKQNELSCNQFQYRWYQHNLALKAKARASISSNEPPKNLFEPITITLPSISPKQTTNVVELAIHLPNQIRCDVKIDLCSNEFSMLLKQLVALC